MPQPDLAVIVPSRGRPHNVARLLDAWDLTRCPLLVNAELWVIVDWDDPARQDYEALLDRDGRPWFNIYQPAPIRRPIGPLINELSRSLAHRAKRIGFCGDDHLPRTNGWDVAIVDALEALGSGIVYGNDLLQGERLPTAAFMTADIIRTLGWMCPPTLEHLYIDDAWAALGQAMGRLRYLPDVIIEHMHPDIGKAERDLTYEEANAPDRNDRDKAAFEAWRRDELPRDLQRLHAAGVY